MNRQLALRMAGVTLVATGMFGVGPAGAAPTPYTAYVANADTNRVTPINVTTGATGTPIAVGVAPQAAVVSPDGTKVYVTNVLSGSVTPITVATGVAGSPIAVGALPWAVAFTPDGAKAYVTNSGGGTVTPITVATNTPGTAISVGSAPRGVAFSPDGSRAYVANSGGTTITPITVATNAPGSPITVGSAPYAVAFTPSGTKAYVANFVSNTVTPITVATGARGTAISVGSGPRGVAVSPDGTKVYVTNSISNSVTPISVATGIAGAAITVGTGPRGVAFAPDGITAYVASHIADRVTPITVATGVVRTAIVVGSGPEDVSFTPDQAPVATFTATTAATGSATLFDASASTVKYGAIATYRWAFGDGQTSDTPTPTTSHTYAAAGSYTATLTEIDTAGTSTAATTSFTGPTMSRRGGPSASISKLITVNQSLGFVTPPGNIAFTKALNGADQVVTATLALGVASGSTDGWNITATSTTFTTPDGRTLANTAVSVPTTPTGVCAATCIPATTNVATPYALPAGAIAPTATKLFNALPGTGDNQTITPTFALAVPGNTLSGNYASTWTISLQSGP